MNSKAKVNAIPKFAAAAKDRRDLFTRVATWTIRVTGGRLGFLTAFGVVIIWALSGPFFNFSSNWQLVINTGTTIVTFLMVFLIQNAQNRESKAVHLKLDELILAVNRARNELIDIENLTEEQLTALSARYSEVAAQNQHKLTECFPMDDDEDEIVHANGEPNDTITRNHMTVK
jgi:low affinity Fe/Cu permease